MSAMNWDREEPDEIDEREASRQRTLRNLARSEELCSDLPQRRLANLLAPTSLPEPVRPEPASPKPAQPAPPSLTEKQVESIAYKQAREFFSEVICDFVIECLERERNAMRAELTRDRETQTQRTNEIESQVLTLRREIADMREARSVSDIPKFLRGTNGDARVQ